MPDYYLGESFEILRIRLFVSGWWLRAQSTELVYFREFRQVGGCLQVRIIEGNFVSFYDGPNLRRDLNSG